MLFVFALTPLRLPCSTVIPATAHVKQWTRHLFPFRPSDAGGQPVRTPSAPAILPSPWGPLLHAPLFAPFQTYATWPPA